MSIRKLVGIIGSGLIGRDPFDPRAWSGSSRFFFQTCNRLGILERAFGVEVSKSHKTAFLLKNFSLDREKWRSKFYLDSKYYSALTDEIAKCLKPSDFDCNVIQIGGIYDVPKAVNGRTACYSYHDGNLAQMLKSPYMIQNIPHKIISRALKFEQQVYNKMTKIFTMSEYLRRSFIDDFGIHESKVANIGAGINLANIPVRHEKNYENNEILFLGVDFYRKGGLQLLKAFRIVTERLPGAKLHIIGPKRVKIENKLCRHVQFHGYISKSDAVGQKLLARIMNDCSLFVLPSLYEPFGIAPLEAMAHQLPCILTDRWAFPEMVTPGFNGDLVPFGNVELLSQKVLCMLRDPDKLKNMGNNARRFVLENYTWDIVVQKLIRQITS